MLTVTAYIRLNGVSAKEHPVFRELTRVKQYFEKIKEVEFGGQKRENLSLDKPTAARFIKHALVGSKGSFHRGSLADSMLIWPLGWKRKIRCGLDEATRYGEVPISPEV